LSDDHLTGRKNVFEINDDEELIGCELYHDSELLNNGKEKVDCDYITGVRWIKMKIIN
jgi:hypothetical protein